MANKNSKSTIRKKAGLYSFLSALIIFLILTLIVLAVYALPTTFTIFDTTPERSLTLSKHTKDFVKKIDEDITIYYICEGGEKEPTLETVLGYYTDLNGHIKVKVVDPYTNPDFIEKYLDLKIESDEDKTYFNYSLVIESEKRFTFISYDTICYYTYEGEEVGGYWTVRYTYDETQLSSLLNNCDEVFDAEYNITSALDYVTVDTLPTMYYIGKPADTLLEMFKTLNIRQEKLTLSESQTKVPDNCCAILITSISQDITTEEKNAVSEYLKQGGHLLICSGAESSKYANLMSLLDGYYISPMEGTIYAAADKTTFSSALNSKDIIASTAADSVFNNYYKVNASYLSNMGITSIEQLKSILNITSLIEMPQLKDAYAIKVEEDIPKDTKVSVIMTSPSDSFLSNDGTNKINNDGSYAVGVSSLKSHSDSVYSEVIIFSSEEFLSDSELSSNKITPYLASTSFAYAGVDGIFVSEVGDKIDPVTRETKYLNTDISDFYIYGAIFVIIIPVAVFVGGLVIWIKRKKR